MIEEIQNRIVDAKIFIKFDISKAYNRIRIKKENEWKIAFRTRLEHFEYLVMSFELTNASATFQTYINNVLRKYLDKFVIVYLNDILIYFKTKKKHVHHVQKVLEAMKRVDLRIKLEKSEFHKEEVKFLDHILFNTEIRSDSKKLKAILIWFTFKKLVKIQFFVELTNYDRKFVKEYSIIAKSLTRLIKKTQSFEWSKKQKQTFQTLKKAFINSAMLKHAKSNLSYVIKIDAFDCEIEDVLLQVDKNNKKRFIVYHSRKMIEAKQNYDIHDKKLLAIIDALKKWRVQLKETKHQVQMMSNHKNLTYFQITKVLNRRQARWAKELATYNFRITHCKRINNVRANALSRRFDYIINKLHQEQQILQRKKDSLVYHKIAIIQLNSESKWTIKFVEAYKHDEIATRNLKISNKEYNKDENELLLFEELLYVSKNLRKKVIQSYHEESLQNHTNATKTLEKIQRNYYFSNMRKQIEKLIKKCDLYQRNKYERHKSYEYLHSLKSSKKSRQFISINFITKLSLSIYSITEVTYDFVLVFVNKLTKSTKFTSF